MASNNGQIGYRISSSQATNERIQSLGVLAKAAGLGPELVSALKAIRSRLQAQPDEWGDPKFDYHAAGLKHYSGRHWMLIVEYAIHEDTHTVFIQSIRPLPGSPLADTTLEE